MAPDPQAALKHRGRPFLRSPVEIRDEVHALTAAESLPWLAISFRPDGDVEQITDGRRTPDFVLAGPRVPPAVRAWTRRVWRAFGPHLRYMLLEFNDEGCPPAGTTRLGALLRTAGDVGLVAARRNLKTGQSGAFFRVEFMGDAPLATFVGPDGHEGRARQALPERRARLFLTEKARMDGRLCRWRLDGEIPLTGHGRAALHARASAAARRLGLRSEGAR